MEKRKIIQFGPSSYITTLPISWLEKNNLSKGDYVFLEEVSNSLILSNGEKNKSEDKKIKIKIDDTRTKLFKKYLISYYLKNYKEIEIISDEEIFPKIEEIKILISNLSFLEISQIKENSIILKDLSDLSSLNFDEMINEIVSVISLMFKESFKNKKFNLIMDLDFNVNKSSFLVFKYVNYIIENSKDISFIKKMIEYRKITNSFEKIGDIIKRISRYLENYNENDISFEVPIMKTKEYFEFIVNFLEANDANKNNLKLYLDKKQSLLKELEDYKLNNVNLNLYLVIFQLLKDIIGQLEIIIQGIVDLNL